MPERPRYVLLVSDPERKTKVSLPGQHRGVAQAGLVRSAEVGNVVTGRPAPSRARGRRALAATEPPLTATVWDAVIAATVEHPCTTHGAEVPMWTYPCRFRPAVADSPPASAGRSDRPKSRACTRRTYRAGERARWWGDRGATWATSRSSRCTIGCRGRGTIAMEPWNPLWTRCTPRRPRTGVLGRSRRHPRQRVADRASDPAARQWGNPVACSGSRRRWRRSTGSRLNRR